MKVISRNIVANFIAKALGSFALILCTPFYTQNLGLEKFGLIGIYNTLIIIFSVLDFGLGTTLNRFLAQNYTSASDAPKCRNFILSIEVVYLITLSALFAGLVLILPQHADKWFQTSAMSAQEIQMSTALIMASTLLIWPVSLYSNGLRGLQFQVIENSLFLAASLARHLGGIAILILYPGSIIHFFGWQASVNFVFLFIFRSTLWLKLSHSTPSKRLRLSFSSLKKQMSFSTNAFMLGILSLLILQYDKIALSKFILLENFACYSTAATLATGLCVFCSSPMQNAFFPALSQALSRQDKTELTNLVRKYAHLIGGIFIPISVMGFCFSSSFISFIMPSVESAELTSAIFKLFLIGYCLNGIAYIPVSTLIAAGKMRFLIWINVMFVIIFIPITIYLSKTYGYLPYNISWVALNVMYLPILIYTVHKDYLYPAFSSELFKVLIYPLACSSLLGAPAFFINTKSFGLLSLASTICTTCALVCSLLTSSTGRNILKTCLNFAFRRPLLQKTREEN